MGLSGLSMGRKHLKFIKVSMHDVVQVELYPFLTSSLVGRFDCHWFKTHHMQEVEKILQPVLTSVEVWDSQVLKNRELKKLSQTPLLGSSVRVGFKLKQKQECQRLLYRVPASKDYRCQCIQGVKVVAYVCPRLQGSGQQALSSAFGKLLHHGEGADQTNISSYFQPACTTSTTTSATHPTTTSSTTTPTTANTMVLSTVMADSRCTSSMSTTTTTSTTSTDHATTGDTSGTVSLKRRREERQRRRSRPERKRDREKREEVGTAHSSRRDRREEGGTAHSSKDERGVDGTADCSSRDRQEEGGTAHSSKRRVGEIANSSRERREDCGTASSRRERREDYGTANSNKERREDCGTDNSSKDEREELRTKDRWEKPGTADITKDRKENGKTANSKRNRREESRRADSTKDRREELRTAADTRDKKEEPGTSGGSDPGHDSLSDWELPDLTGPPLQGGKDGLSLSSPRGPHSCAPANNGTVSKQAKGPYSCAPANNGTVSKQAKGPHSCSPANNGTVSKQAKGPHSCSPANNGTVSKQAKGPHSCSPANNGTVSKQAKGPHSCSPANNGTVSKQAKGPHGSKLSLSTCRGAHGSVPKKLSTTANHGQRLQKESVSCDSKTKPLCDPKKMPKKLSTTANHGQRVQKENVSCDSKTKPGCDPKIACDNKVKPGCGSKSPVNSSHISPKGGCRKPDSAKESPTPSFRLVDIDFGFSSPELPRKKKCSPPTIKVTTKTATVIGGQGQVCQTGRVLMDGFSGKTSVSQAHSGKDSETGSSGRRGGERSPGNCDKKTVSSKVKGASLSLRQNGATKRRLCRRPRSIRPAAAPSVRTSLFLSSSTAASDGSLVKPQSSSPNCGSAGTSDVPCVIKDSEPSAPCPSSACLVPSSYILSPFTDCRSESKPKKSRSSKTSPESSGTPRALFGQTGSVSTPKSSGTRTGSPSSPKMADTYSGSPSVPRASGMHAGASSTKTSGNRAGLSSPKTSASRVKGADSFRSEDTCPGCQKAVHDESGDSLSDDWLPPLDVPYTHRGECTHHGAETNRRERSDPGVSMTSAQREGGNSAVVAAKTDNWLQSPSFVDTDSSASRRQRGPSHHAAHNSPLNTRKRDSSHSSRGPDSKRRREAAGTSSPRASVTQSPETGDQHSVSADSDRPMVSLSEGEVRRLVQGFSCELKDIARGAQHSVRHQLYMQGGKNRRNLDFSSNLQYFASGQEDVVMDILMTHFTRLCLKDLDYLLRVLLPEALNRIYRHVTGRSLPQQEARNLTGCTDWAQDDL